MKKIFFTLSLILAVFILKAQDFNHVLISKELVKGKPAIIYVNYGAEFYLTFRDGKRQFDYKLKLTGSHMMGGRIEYNYTAILPDNTVVKGLSFRVDASDGSNASTAPPTLSVIVNDKTEKDFVLVAI